MKMGLTMNMLRKFLTETKMDQLVSKQRQQRKAVQPHFDANPVEDGRSRCLCLSSR